MYTRGKYGVEFTVNDPRSKSARGIGLFILLIILLSIVPFIWRKRAPKPFAPAVPPPKTITPLIATNRVPTKLIVTNRVPPKATPPQPLAPSTAVPTNTLLRELGHRPPQDKLLLERLAAAEQEGRLTIAIDSLEKLLKRGTVADLESKLCQRLGELNLKLLFNEEVTPWTTTAVVKRGDSVWRVAREHGTTTLATARLNNIAPDATLTADTKLKVLHFPKATLTIELRTHTADLVMNGKFFKRYYVSSRKDTPHGPNTITREKGPRTLFAELGLRMAPDERAELEMFLPPGSYVVIGE